MQIYDGDDSVFPIRSAEVEKQLTNDVLIFESEMFRLDPTPNEKGGHYDLPLGDDIASFLKQELDRKKLDMEILDPCLEDFGTILSILRDKQVFDITVSWQGDNQWAILIREAHGCLGLLWKFKDDLATIERIRTRIDEVVRSDPDRFKNVKWVGKSEFGGIASAFSIPDPKKPTR